MRDDVQAALALRDYHAICCVKRVGIHWPGPFEVFATLHPEFQDDFEARRIAEGHPGGHETVAPFPKEVGMHGEKGHITRRVSYRWPGMNASAGSGIYGAKVMLDAGYHVVLAGNPMNNEPHFLKHEKHGTGPWKELASFLPGFNQALPHLMGRCKSMSGLTRDRLGAPDAQWLAG